MNNQNGFTILEIMIALVLIGTVIVSVMELSSANLRNLSLGGNQMEAMINANSKMREILDKNNYEDRSWNETDEKGYTYEVHTEQIMKERTDSLPVNILEIVLNTNWVNNGKKKQITLKTAVLVFKTDLLKESNTDRR